MMIPVRCFSCGQVVADKWEEYDKRVNKQKEDPKKVLEELGVKRYCCRRMLIGHVDLIDEIINYSRR
ncbi:MAG TPA: DNA-directed RNA polymerase subunit N [Candidatus Saccharimonadales bacterium]|nr:DNA-directed RNA polymerase subunit N [Candidatus Saccharimonadales bacterium]